VSFYIIQTGGNQRKTQMFCERGNIQDVKNCHQSLVTSATNN